MEHPNVVLRLDAAIAVLADGVGEGRAEHDALATRMLRMATGRSDIVVARRPSGRPCLLPPYPELAVSLSWRAGLLLAGFDTACAVGVDVEPGDAATRLEPVRLASDHFSAAEAALVRGAEGGTARDLFLKLWVAKEAALKLTGRGVFDGLREPDLAARIAALVAGTPIEVPPSARLPRLQLAVERPGVAGRQAVPYCALARALS